MGLAGGPEKCQKRASTVAPGVEQLPPIVLRNLAGIREIEAILAAPVASSGHDDASLRERVDVVSIAYFGLTEAQCRPPEPTFFSVNGEHADHTRANQERLEDARYAWDRYEDFFYVLGGTALPAKRRFKMLAEYGIDVLSVTGQPLRCWGYFGRQAVAAIEELFPAAKFDPAAIVPASRSEADPAKWGEAIEREAKRFKSSR